MPSFYMQVFHAESNILLQDIGFVDQSAFPCFEDMITCIILYFIQI